MLQNMYEIGGNVKNCVILSKNALMTKLVTDGTRTILVQFFHPSARERGQKLLVAPFQIYRSHTPMNIAWAVPNGV